MSFKQNLYVIGFIVTTPKLDNNTVYLIDGSGYIFRAYFAVRALSSRQGIPTNAVFGFTTMLLKLLREHKPAYVAIAFDRKEPTFRHQIYPDYKAHRPPPPADLIPQFELIHRLIDAFNIKMLSQPGYEADDLIGTMAIRAKEAGHEVIIVTGDKDFMQLVDSQVFLLDELRASKVGSEKFIDENEVKIQMGVSPSHITDLLALAGDSSDNIPGVSGIGIKTAAQLIQEFGDLEKILTRTPLITQKSRREKLIDGQELARLSKRLVTIDTNVNIQADIKDLIYKNIDVEKTRALFSELDFNRLLRDQSLFEKGSSTLVANSVLDHSAYRVIINDEDFMILLDTLRQAPIIALDTETDNLDSMKANIIGISLSWAENQAAYIPLAHNAHVAPTQLNIKEVLAKLDTIFKDPQKIIIAQNAKYDFKVLTRAGSAAFNIGGDPMLANYLLHQDQESHKLEDLSAKYLHHHALSYVELCGDKKEQISFADVNLKKATDYAAEDADLVLRLEKLLVPKLKNNNLSELYYSLELPLEKVLARMELKGVSIDNNKLSELHKNLHERLKDLEDKAYEIAGMPFNLGSPKQVAHILFEKLALAGVKKTKTGLSTDSSVLEKLQKHHPLAQVLLEHRLCAKLINTYIDTLPKLINKDTHRIHTNYNQFVTATGRLSSSDPNLQNIPIRTPEGRRIRQAFVATPGNVLISLDYSQVELRILAFVSKDNVLLHSFAHDQDVHKRTASEIFDIELEHVTKEQRSIAKTINFGLLYGMGAVRLAESLAINRTLAQGYLNKYFEKYSGILAWKNEVLLNAKKHNEVRTLFGRKRLVPELSSNNPMLRARAERLAINTPIQGSNADIIKKAMIDTDRFLYNNFPNAHLIMQVHDELVIEAPKEDAQNIAENVALIMSKGHGLDLDLKVDYGIATNWDDAH
jgi:DNA polymerase-1